jgi:sugar (pentulose or hexulose) kinase
VRGCASHKRSRDLGRTLPAADELGLDSTTVVCAGALDQACGAIGGENVAPGGFSENTGAARGDLVHPKDSAGADAIAVVACRARDR